MSTRVINVFHAGQEIETVFWYGTRDSLEDIKRCLINHDGYPEDIVVEEYVEEVDESFSW